MKKLIRRIRWRLSAGAPLSPKRYAYAARISEQWRRDHEAETSVGTDGVAVVGRA